MGNSKRKRLAFRPSAIESQLEQRLVLTSGAGVASATSPAVVELIPSPIYAELGIAPPPAAPPVSASEARAESLSGLTVSRLRADYTRQVRAASSDLRSAVETDIGNLYANGAVPTAQQLANFEASVAGALNATTLRLSTQAALLPHSGNRLVPEIQKEILGSGASSLASRLVSLAQSGQLSGATETSSTALTKLFNSASKQTISQIDDYFGTTPVNRLSVNASGQRIPLAQYLGGELLDQVGNTLGSLAQSFPGVANAMLFPDGATGIPTQDTMNAFTTQYNNALSTAAFQLGSGLSLFPGSSNIVSQLQSILYGAGNTTTSSLGGLSTTGLTSSGGTSSTTAASSLISALENLQYGTSGFNTAVSSAFGDAFLSLATPLSSFFGLTGSTNATLPTSGFTNIFGSSLSGSTFNSGFNDGFATGANTGFYGFGMAPSGFNTNFGTGFDNLISTFNQNLGLIPSTTATGLSNTGTTGTGTGTTGTGTGTTGTGTGITGTGTGTGTTGTGTANGDGSNLTS